MDSARGLDARRCGARAGAAALRACGAQRPLAVDAKDAYPLADRQRCHTRSVLDDHSRFVVGLTPLLRLQTAPVRAALIRGFEHYGVPAAMLMDHGTPWWSSQGPAGLTSLGVFLLKQGIRLVFSAVRHPADPREGRTVSSHARRAVAVGRCARRPWRASPGQLSVGVLSSESTTITSSGARRASKVSPNFDSGAETVSGDAVSSSRTACGGSATPALIAERISIAV